MIEKGEPQFPAGGRPILEDQYPGNFHRCRGGYILYLLNCSGSIFSSSSVHLSVSPPSADAEAGIEDCARTVSETRIRAPQRRARAMASLGRASMRTLSPFPSRCRKAKYVLSRMSAISTLRSSVPVAWRMDFMRSCVIGRGSSAPSSASAIALASSRPIQIGTTLPVSGSRRTTIGDFVTGSIVTPATVTSLGMGRPFFPDEGVGPRTGHEDGPDWPFSTPGSEVHRLVAGGSTATHSRVPCALSFDENRDLPTDLRREAFPGVRRLKLLQA